ncbi:hypothetical protein [Deinococcus ficus]|uniref:hypothetical protein n=1 Tax=Deinococcus ficus TaxID=317577 RepID=UPI00174D6F4E|nr:hypothetical protein [Deinococcus ficus]GHF91512.1 hypothetical protein GCM10017782_30440 [Deinococcus ficus]
MSHQELLPPLPDPRALNSRKHGILSDLVPAHERDGYAAHVQSVRESVGAVSYLEQRLADRAALALWRLDRVARWEATELEADRRRFQDRLKGKVTVWPDPYGVQEAPVDALNLRESLEALAKMTGESVGCLARDPETVELVAQDRDREAAAWEAIRQGAEATLTAEQAGSIGVPLLAALQQEWNADPTRLAKLLVGRKPTREEAQAVADWDWNLEPHEVAPLVAEAVRLAGREAWSSWLLRAQYKASGEAGKLRAVLARLPDLMHQEQQAATEPDGKRLDKVARYEAHLERVLYRSLRELRDLQQADALPDMSALME